MTFFDRGASVPTMKPQDGETLDIEALANEVEGLDAFNEGRVLAYESLQLHGAKVAQALFERYGLAPVRFYDPVEAPEACPWRFTDNSPAHVIDVVWAPLRAALPKLIAALLETCVAVVIRESRGEWRILYALNRCRPNTKWRLYGGENNGYTMMMGGPPLLSADVRLPSQLSAFLAVHDGFGVGGAQWDCTGTIGPLASIEPLRADMPGFLEFWCDDVGNRQLVVPKGVDRSLVCDWDHETHTLSREEPFFAWVDGHITCTVLDLSLDERASL